MTETCDKKRVEGEQRTVDKVQTGRKMSDVCENPAIGCDVKKGVLQAYGRWQLWACSLLRKMQREKILPEKEYRKGV